MAPYHNVRRIDLGETLESFEPFKPAAFSRCFPLGSAVVWATAPRSAQSIRSLGEHHVRAEDCLVRESTASPQ